VTAHAYGMVGLLPPPEKDAYLKSRLEKFMLEVSSCCAVSTVLCVVFAELHTMVGLPSPPEKDLFGCMTTRQHQVLCILCWHSKTC
jgi:hypothetical protein